MNDTTRKAALNAYKERKIQAGIYAVRCTVSGQVWVGSAPDLTTIQNRLWFTLQQGGNLHRSLQQAWHDHGAEAFRFEVLEHFTHEDSAYVRDNLLDELRTRWLDKLQAQRI